MPNGDHHTYSAYDLADTAREATQKTALAMVRAVVGAAAQRFNANDRGRAEVVIALMDEERITEQVVEILRERAESHREAQERISRKLRGL